MTMQLRRPMNSAEFGTLLDSALYVAPRTRIYRNAAKRAKDILIVLLAAPVVVPIVAILACMIALDGRNPFYCQNRVGLNGRIFRMWKLRSMVSDADKQLEVYLAKNPAAREEWELHQKLKNDPRITRMGQFIRKTSLDELPQLWNVLRGDMSLVGPRPMMVSQQVIYPGSSYYAMRPGITGLWQVSARNETSFAERASFDAEYFERLSLVTDLKVMARTVSVVVKGTGC